MIYIIAGASVVLGIILISLYHSGIRAYHDSFEDEDTIAIANVMLSGGDPFRAAAQRSRAKSNPSRKVATLPKPSAILLAVGILCVVGGIVVYVAVIVR